jgi:hypothetical protein
MCGPPCAIDPPRVKGGLLTLRLWFVKETDTRELSLTYCVISPSQTLDLHTATTPRVRIVAKPGITQKHIHPVKNSNLDENIKAVVGKEC